MKLSTGLGLKPEHFDAACACTARGVWFEVHAENYMVDGGPRLAWLDAVRTHHPLSLHGVALSLAADAPLDRAHLARLAALVQRYEPALVSEHLAWASWQGQYFPDLLPVPRTHQALLRIVDHVHETQEVLGRQIAVENPSHYLHMPQHEYEEVEFLAELAQRSGCALLLDVNNVYVSAHNLGISATDYIDTFPVAAIAEVHLAGHTQDMQADLLIDSHDQAICSDVWALYQRLIRRTGPLPTLIERDGNLPEFVSLLAERDIAEQYLSGISLQQPMALRFERRKHHLEGVA